ncbi:MAG: hypothetical protein ACTSV2_07445 [Candidatus Thorarchaeota archaeon]
MSARSIDFTGLKELRKKYSKITFEDNKQLLIISSPQTHAIISSSILSRAALKSGLLFHVKFLEPVVYADDIIALVEKHSNTVPILIGIDVIGTLEKIRDQLVFLGGSRYEENDEYKESSNEISISFEAYSLARESMQCDTEDFLIAILGEVTQRGLVSTDKMLSKDALQYAIDMNLLQPRKGIKIPGANFIPMNDALQFCIHPYIDGLSGIENACQRLFQDADIPLAKWSIPLSKLTNEEATKLTTNLVMIIKPDTVGKALGIDYELLTEHSDCSFRRVSNIISMARVVWSRREMGMLLGVLVGDRARTLRRLEDIYLKHCKEVTKGLQEILVVMNDSDTQVESSTYSTTIPFAVTSNETLSDIGQIILQNNPESKEFLIIKSAMSLDIIWQINDISLVAVLTVLRRNGLSVVSTSKKSVKVDGISKETLTKSQGVLDGIIRERK